MRKFNKQRLSKLVFWIVHIIAIISLLLGVIQLIRNDSYQKMIIELMNKTCVRDDFDCSMAYLSQIDDYTKAMFQSLTLGIGLLAGYWVIRWIYKFIFPEVKNNDK